MESLWNRFLIESTNKKKMCCRKLILRSWVWISVWHVKLSLISKPSLTVKVQRERLAAPTSHSLHTANLILRPGVQIVLDYGHCIIVFTSICTDGEHLLTYGHSAKFKTSGVERNVFEACFLFTLLTTAMTPAQRWSPLHPRGI